MKIPFSPPYIDDDVKREVLEVLESGWITSGPKVRELENLVAQRVGIDHVVCCNSATSGLMLMLHWFGVGPGDEVIIPAYTYAATALVVIHAGATPVMVDVNDDFNINVTEIRRKITSRTKAIIPVDIAGWPCDYQGLEELVNEPATRQLFQARTENQKKLGRILILADAAHSIGATHREKPVGRWGDFAVFSFHAVKNITTAEGGAICINPPKSTFDHEMVFKQLKLWTLNGQTKDAFTKTAGGGWRYDIVYPGFKINMPDICAAIGLAQLRKYDESILNERRRVFRAYTRFFSKYPWVQLPPQDSSLNTSSYHLYALRIVGIGENARDQIIEEISKRGVSVNVHFQPLPLLTVFKERGFLMKDYPRAFENYSREISLPIYPELDQEKINYIVKVVMESHHAVLNVKAGV